MTQQDYFAIQPSRKVEEHKESLTMSDDEQCAGTQDLDNFDVAFNPFAFDKGNNNDYKIEPQNIKDVQGSFFDHCFQHLDSPDLEMKSSVNVENPFRIFNTEDSESATGDVFFSGSFEDLFENDEKENISEAFVSINRDNLNEWTEPQKEKFSIDIISPPTVSTYPDSSNDSLSLHDNDKYEQDEGLMDDKNPFSDSFTKCQKLWNIVDTDSFEFFGSEYDASNFFPNNKKIKEVNKKELENTINQSKQIKKEENEVLGDKSFANSFIQFDGPDNFNYNKNTSFDGLGIKHFDPQGTLRASPILPLKLLPIMDGTIASKTVNLDAMSGDQVSSFQGGNKKQSVNNGPTLRDNSQKKRISFSLPQVDIATKIQQRSSLLSQSPSPFYRNAFATVSPEKKIEKEAIQVTQNDSVTQKNNERKSLLSLPETMTPINKHHDSINKSWKQNSTAQTISTQETESEATFSDTFLTNSTSNSISFESESNKKVTFDKKHKKKHPSKQHSNQRASTIESDECEETLSITVDLETTFDSIYFSSEGKHLDPNKSNYVNPKTRASDSSMSEDRLRANSRHHRVYEISPISLVPYFDEELSVFSHINQVKSNIRPSIIFSLEESMKWRSGIYLCFGSANFGDTNIERIRNALDLRIDHTIVNNHDKDSKGELTNQPYKFENKLNNLKTPIEELLEIEKWINKLQAIAVQCVRDQKFNDALALYQRILAIFKEYPKHPVTGTIHHNLGLIHMHVGDFDKARESLLSATSIRKVANGVMSTDILNTICMMSLTEYALGNNGEAKSILSEGIRFVLSELGEDELKLSEMMNNLACIFISEQRFPSTLKLLQKSFELQTQSIRNLSYSTDEDCKNIERRYRLINLSTTVANIGVTKLFTKDYNSAIIAFEDTLLNQLLVLKPHDPLILSTMDSLAHANTELNVTGKALVIYSKLMQIIRAKLGPNNMKCAQIWREVSIIHRQKGNLKRAIRCIYQLLKCFSRNQNHDSNICTEFVSLVTEETKELKKMELELEAKEARSKTMASF